MKSPSIHALATAFRNLSPDEINLIRKLARNSDDREVLRAIIDTHCPATSAYARQCYSDPYDSSMWRKTLVLHALNVILDTCGVEALNAAADDATDAPAWEYLNAGDTYATTLVYFRDAHALRIACWGDIAERNEVV